MRWRRTRPATTRELLRAEHQPRAQVARSYRPLLWAALALAMAFAAVHFWRGSQQAETQRRIDALQAGNAALAADLQRQRLLTAEAQATREQLQRRIDQMSGELKKLKTDLAFYRQQKPAK
ncbi:hypothetical protein P3W55_15965 [Pseudomonas citronellolis]|uniref:Uncharacterized protein n=1 Tax=Pseudomonas citronellolis TaxID=53408 RepID=A0AAW6PAJ5_9PSED|nr:MULTISPECIES: metallopeptidase [Pseudomonas]KSW26263.1 hypothetical protein AOX63_21760 [Pseudomonas sp. ADP]MBB1607794.1 hypothetical protein [Pseudomonas sp. UMC76]MBB1638926.1 hypothetical protein [Pseudomonas sp. UME83]MBH3433114.1 hypothetical protein [Pseudomonas citronellolis]MDF3843209.1 hypothetical protein [Pseudomonas citronellolis]